MNVLIVLPNYVGDVVMAIPGLKAFAKVAEKESLSFHVLTKSTFAGILKSQDYVKNVVAIDIRSPKEIAKIVSDHHFDAALSLTRSGRFHSAFRKAKIPLRAGLHQWHLPIFGLNYGIRADGWKPPFDKSDQVEFYFQLFEQFLFQLFPKGDDCHREIERTRDFTVSLPEPSEKVRQLRLPQKFVAIAPGSSSAHKLKRWPLSRYLELWKTLSERETGLSSVWLFGSSDHELFKKCQQSDLERAYLAPPCSLNLGEVFSIVSSASLVVANDSGTRHIGVSCGVRTISIFGPTLTERVVYPAMLDRPISIDIQCHRIAGCTKRSCRHKHVCMTTITSEKVIAEINELKNVG